jgi:hypothetical protein
MTQDPYAVEDSILDFESEYKRMSHDQLAERAVTIATNQIMACTEFKKPRLVRLDKYWRLYDGKVDKKLRQLFNVPIPVFAGMIDTLNAQYDTPVDIDFGEGDASDYFKVEKVKGAWHQEVMNSANTSKWDSKLRMARKHAIMNGVAFLEYTVDSDPEYNTELTNVSLKNMNFQPKGGLYLENHLFAGTEDIDRTKSQLLQNASSGFYNKAQVMKLIHLCADRDYLPFESNDLSQTLSRFKPLGLDPDNHSYVGQAVYKLASHIIEIDGTRWYLVFHPWSKTWLRFEKWKDTCSSDLMPWVKYATHEDDENILSKSYGDDLYHASDAIVSMFNQELTNREKRNFGARAYDKDMFTDVRKLDEAMHRPDALVPADTKGGTRRIQEGIYEFKVGELGGTVNLIDWITGSLGRNTGATDLAMGGVQEVSKKASVTFAEQKSVSKRIGWGSQAFQDMMTDLGNRFIYGLKDHMPAKMAVRTMGKGGWDWDEITRLDLSTTKPIDVIVIARDQQVVENEAKAKRRTEALTLVMQSPNINGKKRDEEILRSVGDYTDEEVAEFMDVQTYSDRKAIKRAEVAIEHIIRDEEVDLWYGANIAFMQKILDYASDRRSTLKDKYEKLVNYAMAHQEIAQQNIETKIAQQATQQAPTGDTPLPNPSQTAPQSQAENPGMSGGMSHAMSIGMAA